MLGRIARFATVAALGAATALGACASQSELENYAVKS